MEVNKKRDAELQKLQQDLEDVQVQHEAQVAAFRKKYQELQSENTEQAEQLQKSKLRWQMQMLSKPSRFTKFWNDFYILLFMEAYQFVSGCCYLKIIDLLYNQFFEFL